MGNTALGGGLFHSTAPCQVPRYQEDDPLVAATFNGVRLWPEANFTSSFHKVKSALSEGGGTASQEHRPIAPLAAIITGKDAPFGPVQATLDGTLAVSSS